MCATVKQDAICCQIPVQLQLTTINRRHNASSTDHRFVGGGKPCASSSVHDLLALSGHAWAQAVPDFTKVFTSGSLVSGSIVAPTLGSVIRIQNEDKAYKFVRNVGLITTAGDVVCYSVTNVITQTAMYEVTKPATANLNVMAGVALGAIPATTGQGWIQIHGYNPTVNVTGDTDITLGDSLKGVNGQFYATKDTAIGTSPTYVNHIIAAEAYATNFKGEGSLHHLQLVGHHHELGRVRN